MIRFEIYVDQAGEYRWRLVAANNETVCWSEGYTAKQNAINSVYWVKRRASTASIRNLA